MVMGKGSKVSGLPFDAILASHRDPHFDFPFLARQCIKTIQFPERERTKDSFRPYMQRRQQQQQSLGARWQLLDRVSHRS